MGPLGRYGLAVNFVVDLVREKQMREMGPLMM